MFENRRKNLIQQMQHCRMNAVLISNPSNLYYYTGFTGGEAFFLMHVDTERGYMITDSRYYEQVEKECPELILVRLEQKRYSEVVKELLDCLFTDNDNGVKHDKQSKNKEMIGTVAIEDSMSLAQYLKLSEVCNQYTFEVRSEELNASRMIKDDTEVELIRKAEAIGDEAFTYILDILKPGVSETEIALELEFFLKKHGASKLSFDTIVASGPNSSMPHAQVTERKLAMGDFVTMDFGCVYKGYCSDMTRTVAIGKATEEMRKVYRIVLDANRRAKEQIETGKACNYIDSLARDYIAEQGFGEYFGHGLGHGVGLDIHEEPRFSPKCDVELEKNMVITVEPGIYLPGKFGVRIEDLVVVRNDGYECLSHSDRELIIL